MLPERVNVAGVQYVELACKPDDLSDIESLLTKVGMVKTGTHKSKLVTRFQNGTVNILLNYDPAGRSFALASEHGAVVSEIAFATPDADAAQKRAVALGAEPVAMPHKADEQSIPTVRGIAKCLIRFLDPTMNIWRSDFDTTFSEPINKKGVQRFDHIAQSMGFDEMMSWTQFYTSIFCMVKSPMVDVIDPDGVIRSQVVTSREGGFHLTLNGSEGQRTSAHRFVADGAGATVQHLAFAVNNAVELAEHLHQHGFSILPQTENYYADLAARFDLPNDFITRIKALHVLYDEDETGSFLHFYSTVFGNGLFFE
ncbi:MAG: 4-hydroxyphenylpyruvate dioxygenase family protein, partial [Candidatus Puniceispirillaceae bacterium]